MSQPTPTTTPVTTTPSAYAATAVADTAAQTTTPAVNSVVPYTVATTAAPTTHRGSPPPSAWLAPAPDTAGPSKTYSPFDVGLTMTVVKGPDGEARYHTYTAGGKVFKAHGTIKPTTGEELGWELNDQGQPEQWDPKEIKQRMRMPLAFLSQLDDTVKPILSAFDNNPYDTGFLSGATPAYTHCDPTSGVQSQWYEHALQPKLECSIADILTHFANAFARGGALEPLDFAARRGTFASGIDPLLLGSLAPPMFSMAPRSFAPSLMPTSANASAPPMTALPSVATTA